METKKMIKNLIFYAMINTQHNGKTFLTATKSAVHRPIRLKKIRYNSKSVAEKIFLEPFYSLPT